MHSAQQENRFSVVSVVDVQRFFVVGKAAHLTYGKPYSQDNRRHHLKIKEKYPRMMEEELTNPGTQSRLRIVPILFAAMRGVAFSKLKSQTVTIIGNRGIS